MNLHRVLEPHLGDGTSTLVSGPGDLTLKAGSTLPAPPPYQPPESCTLRSELPGWSDRPLTAKQLIDSWNWGEQPGMSYSNKFLILKFFAFSVIIFYFEILFGLGKSGEQPPNSVSELARKKTHAFFLAPQNI